MELQEEKKIQLDGKEVTLQELNEAKQKTQNPLRIVEVSPGEYKTLTRLQE